MTRERLQKFLAHRGVASRRAAERLIADGRVQVNGEVTTLLGTTVDPDSDRVEVDGQLVAALAAAPTHILLHKPLGIISTASDPEGRKTVLDVVGLETRLYPVGRLDAESEGLTLLTDDGDLAMRLTHPRHEVEKEYHALLHGDVTAARLRRLANGVELDDGRVTAPATVEVLSRGEAGAWVRFVLHEGRNRQIRRMAAAVGLDVARLVRVRIGSLTLGDLAPGAWRHLEPRELNALRRETA